MGFFISIFINHCQLNIFYEHNHHQGGSEIDYKDWGKGPVVTFSHGWPLSSDAWDGEMLFLVKNGFRVVAHDRRGHGRSSQASSGNDMNGYAESSSGDRDTRSQERNAGRPFDRWRRSCPLHREPRDETGRQSGPHSRRAANHVEIRSQSRGTANRGLRHYADWSHEGLLAILQRPGDTILRSQ